MRKLLLYADPHFSQSSSILIGRTNEFSGKLENLIKSFQWIERVCLSENIDKNDIICLGDFADKPVLTSEELSAIHQCNVQHHRCLVGNHCRSDKEGYINSISALMKAIHFPIVQEIEDRKILFLPYNSTPVNLDEFGHVDIILSHNDLKGYDFGGGHISSQGYEIQDILDHCDLFINGHLHNGGWLVKDRIVNLGTLSGMNFSSCGGEWEPSIGILDLETMHLEIRENPYALRFKKVEFDTLPKLKGYLDNLPDLTTYVLQVKVPASISVESRKLIDQSQKVLASRIIVKQESGPKLTSIQESVVKEETHRKSIYEKLREYLDEQKNLKYSKETLQEIVSDIETRDGGEQ